MLTNDIEAALRDLEARRGASNDNAMRVASEMIAGVRARGDAFVREQIERFDRVTLDQILIAPRETTIDNAMRDAIELAIERIEAFHKPQLPQSYRWNGIEHRVRPLRRVGIYVPGGRAVYLSTLIMCAVPARIAGVRELVLITTPAAASRDELHYACSRLGITAIYQCGGAAGIAAAAFGTESLPRVDKIVGPGNQYVTAAKAQLVGTVGIDMTAGPTELVVIADESSDATLVQADLDAQAEHGEDSAVICISIGCSLDVRATLNLRVESVDDAIAITDRIAPEHVSIHARGAAEIAERLENCGAIFCGPFSPVAAGDYVAGPNHVLPTGGSARFFSPLGVYDFVKRSNVIALSADELAKISEAGERIAEFEGLPKHAASMAVRRTYVA
ncbi:MAG: histidinol dehydrogenase [Thermoanaerobaculia bacterium]|jgi:histidinol dehydrogenase|nr:histidinol dehydrogenase [Thermoanaerobaculia bacterium]